MTQKTWIQTQLRGLFASINYCIYSLIKWIIQGVFDIANLTSNFTLVDEMRSRMYVLLGIFMIFKVTISLINYMLNPDAIADKDKGAGKLVGRTVISLAFLILLPFFFEKMNQAQSVFLPVLPRVILGQNKDNSDTIEKNSEAMAVAALRAFYRPCDACETEVDLIDSLSDMNATYADAASRTIPKEKKDDDSSKDDADKDEESDEEEEGEEKNVYDYEFNYIFALIVGVIMVLILLGITLSVAIRVFKLFLLEMLAPIPIISFIDPKSAKNGAFASWLKQVVLTFVDIFVKLGLIYIVLYLMSKMTSNGADALFDFGNMKKSEPRYLYLQVFLILGLLLFAKDAPKFVKDALGLKENNRGFLEGFLGGISGATAGLASGAISGHGITGALTGAATGFNAGYAANLEGKKANAWRLGGDAAKQTRTGDAKAKSGILAALASASSHAQGRRELARYGITEESLAIGDADAKSKAAFAAKKESEYQELLHRGASAAEIENARKARDAAKMASEKASSKLKKAEDAWERRMGKASDRSKYIATRKSAAKERGYVDTTMAIDRKRRSSAPAGSIAGEDYPTINDPSKSRADLYDDIDTRRTFGEAVTDHFQDPIDQTRNDSNYHPYS